MSDFTVTELLLFQLILIVFNAIFACAEIAVISINDVKLKKMAEAGDKRAARLVSLTAQPAKFLATIQVGITLAGFLGSAFAADNFSDRIVDWLVAEGVTISPHKLDVMVVIGITFVLSYVTLIWGELVPKRIAMQYAEKIGLFMSTMIYAIAKLFSPIVWFLTFSTNLSLRLLGVNPEEKNEKVTEEEIRIMIDVGTENGTIDDTEKKMLHNVFEFDDKFVSEVMTYRTEVEFLDVDDDTGDWERIMVKTRHTVYPVYKENTDHIVGILNIKDYFKYRPKGKSAIVNEAIKPALFIAKTQHINDLFHHMQKSRIHFAIVVDEYGGISGIVTMNDLLEEIVGDLEDDTSAPPATPDIKQVNKNSWVIQGDTPLDEVAETLGLDFAEFECETFAGFVLSLMDEIPLNKKNVKLTYQNLRLKLLETNGHKIERVLLQKTDMAEEGASCDKLR